MIAITLAAVLLASDEPPPTFRLNVDASLGLAQFHRTGRMPGDQGAASLGLDLFGFPSPIHGVFVGILGAGGFASVTAIDAGYALRLGEQNHHRGVTADFVATFGPSLAFVGDPIDERTRHFSVLGARASATGHLYFWKIAVGLTLAYRGGVTLGTNDGYCGMVSGGLTLGFVIDP